MNHKPNRTNWAHGGTVGKVLLQLFFFSVSRSAWHAR